MSLCGISRRRLIAGTAAAAALSQVSAESLSIASAGREAVVYQPENRGIYTQSDSSKKSSRNIWSLAVVSVDQRY